MNRILLTIDSILILGILISAFLLLDYNQPMVIAPLKDGGTLLFTLPMVEYILVDDNSRFESPETMFIDQIITLDTGKYFIKFFYDIRSEIRVIDLEINADLQIRIIDENTIGVFNVGETDLQIDTYDTGSKINSSIAYSGENE
ncbi:MAG: hypothetical protein AABX10_01575 [Nanoarchaeota archaeon]